MYDIGVVSRAISFAQGAREERSTTCVAMQARKAASTISRFREPRTLRLSAYRSGAGKFIQPHGHLCEDRRRGAPFRTMLR